MGYTKFKAKTSVFGTQLATPQDLDDRYVIRITPVTTPYSGLFAQLDSDGGAIPPQDLDDRFELAPYNYPDRTIFEPNEDDASGYFGNSVAINAAGDVIVVGSPEYSNQLGYVTAFEKQPNGTWSKFHIHTSLSTNGEAIGTSVAINAAGDIIVAGSPFIDSNQGKIAVFKRTNTSWGGGYTFNDITPSSRDVENFGYSVAINAAGDTIAVGAPLYPTNSSDGRVVVFHKTGANWGTKTEKILTPTTSQSGELFGQSVAINNSGVTVVVGAPDYNGTYANSGRAIVFHSNNVDWSIATITQTVLTNNISESFGSSVAIDKDWGDAVVVGAPSGNGRAFLFNVSTFWGDGTVTSTELIPNNSYAGELFGTSVSIDTNNNIIVGAPHYNTQKGRCIIFNYTGDWNAPNTAQINQNVIVLDPSQDLERFGYSVAINTSGDTFVVGAPMYDKISFTDNGRAILFS